MIKVSVFYPHKEGARFDMAYYLNTHIPMVAQKLGAAVKSASVEHGLGGISPASAPAFVVMAHFGFDSMDAFQAAFGPHAAVIMADIPNYTSIEPLIQISDVKLAQGK